MLKFDRGLLGLRAGPRKGLALLTLIAVVASAGILASAPTAQADDDIPIVADYDKCINDADVLANEDMQDAGVGDFYSDGTFEYVLVSGHACDFDCLSGFDINCDGKLGDYCPIEFNRHVVKGVKACLESFEESAS